GRSRFWRLRFDDVTNPQAGGTVEMLLDGTGPYEMFDNITVDHAGHVLLQEDPGNQPYVARVWQYDIANRELIPVAEHTRSLFAPGGSQFLTQDEESSGVLDLSGILGPGYYALDVQAHFTNPDPALVEGGQFLILNTNAPTATLTDGVLKVQGTINNDQITVS